MRCKLKGTEGQVEAIVTFLMDPDLSFDLDDTRSHSIAAQRSTIIRWAKRGYEVNVNVPAERVMDKLKEALDGELRFRPPGFPKAAAVRDRESLREAFATRLERTLVPAAW